MKQRIVVCGESLMDVFQQDATAAGLSLNAVVGGAPLNVAVGIARMGGTVSFLSGVSSDFLGQRIAQKIRAESIDEACLVACDAPTTLSVVGVDERGVPSYRFYGQGGADRQITQADLHRVPADAAAIHCGSYACVVEPVAGALRRLIEDRHRHTFVSYDPNVRLNVEPDLSVWRRHLDWMSTRSHLIKLSDEDFQQLHGDASPDDWAASRLAMGVKLVMMTRGGDGATCWHATGRCDVQAPAVTVVDTVGAGDTFQAATLIGLDEIGHLSPLGVSTLTQDELGRLATFAASAAALTCTRQGPDLPRRQDLPSKV